MAMFLDSRISNLYFQLCSFSGSAHNICLTANQCGPPENMLKAQAFSFIQFFFRLKPDAVVKDRDMDPFFLITDRNVYFRSLCMLDDVLKSFLYHPEHNEFLLIRYISFNTFHLGGDFNESAAVDPADLLGNTVGQAEQLQSFAAEAFRNIA